MMKNKLLLIKDRRTYLYTMALLTIILLSVYISFGIFPFGSKTLLTSDMRSQYIDFLSYFKDMHLSKYSFKLGIGNDSLSFFAYYLASPVNLLVFFFKNISDAASAIFVVKLFLAAFTCNFYLKHSKVLVQNDTLEKVMPILSAAYAFCGFTMMYSMNIIWFDTVYIFPLLILSIENALLNNGKSMSLWIALIIITGFYTGIMAIYFSWLYCIALYFIFRDKVSFFKMIYNYFIGVSMSAIVLMPTLIRLSSNKMTSDNFLYKLALFLGKDISDIFELALLVWLIVLLMVITINIIGKWFKHKQNFKHRSQLNTILFVIFGCLLLIVNIFFLVTSFRRNAIGDLKYLLPFTYDKDAPQLYSGFITYMGLLLIVCNLKKDFKRYIVLLLLLAVSFVPIFSTKMDILLHAGQEPISFPYRYTFIITFFMIIVSSRGFSSFSGKKLSTNTKYGLKVLGTVLCCIFAVELYANALGAFKYNEVNWFGYTEREAFNCFVEKTGDAVEHIDDDSFYRVEKHFNRNINDAMQLNYNGINHYSSMYNHEFIDLLNRLGCICTIHYGTYIGHTPLMDSLLGVKYTLGTRNATFLEKCTISKDDNFTYYDDIYKKIYTNEYVNLYENPAGDTFALYANDEILDMDLNKTQHMSFDLLNDIYNSIIGRVANPYKEQKILEDGPNTFEIEAATSGRLFIKTSPGIEYKNIFINGVSVGSGYYEMFGYVNPNVYCAGVDAGDTVTLKFDSTAPISVNDIAAYVEADEVYDEITDFLHKNKIDYTFNSEDEIILNVSSNGDTIFTNIPFDENWTVISEKNVVKKRVFNTFLGLEAPAGNYTITLKYSPSGLLQSSIISILAVLNFFVFV